MPKYRLIALMTLVTMIVISACSSNQQIAAEPEPVRNPLALAREAATEGADFYEDGLFEQALAAFALATDLFKEAAPMATERDSIALNLERMELNVAKAHVDLAMESTEYSMYNEAIDHYESALDVYLNHEPVNISQEELDEYIRGTYNNLAITARESGDYEKAIEYYDDLLVLEPGNADVLNAKFFILKDFVQDNDRAFQVLEDYAAAASDASAYIMLAEGYAQAGNYEGAEAAYMMVEELRPNADTYTRIGNFYRANSQWERANEYLQKLAETNPPEATLAVVYAQMGQNFSQMGNTAKMIEFLEKSVALEPNPRLALTLAGHFNSARNWAKVVTYSSMVLQQEANNSAARMLRGVAYYQQQNMNAAKADLERLVNDPTYGAQAQNILKAIN